jgi:hypothetical protein
MGRSGRSLSISARSRQHCGKAIRGFEEKALVLKNTQFRVFCWRSIPQVNDPQGCTRS